MAAIRLIPFLVITASLADCRLADDPSSAPAAAVAAAQPLAAAQAAGTQIVFSATAEPGSFGGSGDPHYGFWIWCEAAGTNPYAGSEGSCAGSMYFYAIQPATEQVIGTVTLSGQQATMTVASATTALENISCTLANLSAMSGPTNTVTVSCTNNSAKPGPTGSATTNPNVIVKLVTPTTN